MKITEFISVDELKTSALILCLTLLSAIAVVECFRIGDIPPNLKDLMEFLIAAIAGINIVGRNFIRSDKKDEAGNS